MSFEFNMGVDPKRSAILLIGGNKAGDDQFYERMVPVADRIYDKHLVELEQDKVQAARQQTEPKK